METVFFCWGRVHSWHVYFSEKSSQLNKDANVVEFVAFVHGAVLRNYSKLEFLVCLEREDMCLSLLFQGFPKEPIMQVLGRCAGGPPRQVFFPKRST